MFLHVDCKIGFDKCTLLHALPDYLIIFLASKMPLCNFHRYGWITIARKNLSNLVSVLTTFFPKLRRWRNMKYYEQSQFTAELNVYRTYWLTKPVICVRAVFRSKPLCFSNYSKWKSRKLFSSEKAQMENKIKVDYLNLGFLLDFKPILPGMVLLYIQGCSGQ